MVENEQKWRSAAATFREDVDSNFNRYLEELKELCRIPSISADSGGLWDCARFLQTRLVDLGFDVSLGEAGGGYDVPVIIAKRHRNPQAPTLLVYGHFDVQPVDPLNAWTTPPFEPTERDGYLYGRGTADDKGQFFAHFKAIEMLDRLGIDDLANLTFILDSQEEVGSPRLAGFVEENRDSLSADYVFYADGEAFPGNRVMMQHGNRGDCFMTITHTAASRDAHSGTYGGVLPNAANELVAFLATLVDAEGTVQIPGFYDDIVPPTDADREAMARLPYDRENYLKEMGIDSEFGPEGLTHWEKIMFRPTLNIAGLTAGYQGKGTKTVIPCQASAKIDMRLVKNLTPEKVLAMFLAHAASHGMEGLEIELGMQYLPARTAVDHPFGKMVGTVLGIGFSQEPVVTPVVGGSNPNHVWMEMLGLPMAEVSYGQYDCRMHAPDECYALENFRNGIVTSALVFMGAAGFPAGGSA